MSQQIRQTRTFPLARSVAFAALMSVPLVAAPLTVVHAQSKALPVATAPAGEKSEGVEQRITQLHAELKIAPDQESKWNSVAQAMRDNASNMDKLVAEKRQQAPQNMTAVDDLKTYARKVLARQNLKVAVVGDIDAETLKPILDRVFGALPEQPDLVAIASATPQGLGRRIDINLDVPQTVVDFGGPGIARKDPDFMAAYLINHILGGGSSDSRLYQEVREKRGLVYSIADSLIWLDHSAILIGGTATRADRTNETIDLVQKEIRRFAEDGPTAAELTEAKNNLNSSFALNLDTSSKIASLLVQLQLDGLNTDYFTKRPDMINAVTLDDAKRVAKRLLDNGLLITVVGKPQAVASTTPTAN